MLLVKRNLLVVIEFVFVLFLGYAIFNRKNNRDFWFA